ncbi:MAG: anti-sigma factor family protein [Candidatus Rokuibacteriota bacterium]
MVMSGTGESSEPAGAAPSEIECRQIAELLADYLDGSLPSRTAELLEWHIDGCPPCVAFLNTYRGTIRATRSLRSVEVPAELKQRMLAFLRTQDQSR